MLHNVNSYHHMLQTPNLLSLCLFDSAKKLPVGLKARAFEQKIGHEIEQILTRPPAQGFTFVTGRRCGVLCVLNYDIHSWSDSASR